MSQNQYPPAGGSQGGGVAAQSAPQGAAGQPGYTQPAGGAQGAPAPAANRRGGASPQAGGGGGGPFSVFGAPKSGGAAKALWLGALLMLFAFFVKQVLVDLSLWSVSSGMQETQLELEKQIATQEIDSELDELRDKLEDLELEAPKVPDDPDDMESYQDDQKNHEEDVKDLQEKIAEKEEDLKEKYDEINKEYRPQLREADRDSTKSQASGTARFRWMLYLKLVLDLLKVLGAALVVFAGLRISLDPEQSAGAKAYAAVLGGIAFLSVVLGGLWSLIA